MVTQWAELIGGAKMHTLNLKLPGRGRKENTDTYAKREQVHAHRKLMRRATVGKYDHGMNNLEETKR